MLKEARLCSGLDAARDNSRSGHFNNCHLEGGNNRARPQPRLVKQQQRLRVSRGACLVMWAAWVMFFRGLCSGVTMGE